MSEQASAENDAARLALIRDLERHIGAHASIVANDLLAAGWRVIPPARSRADPRTRESPRPRSVRTDQ